MELRAVALQIFDHRQDHGLILVVLCEAQRPQIRQTVDMVDEALHIALHFQRAVAGVEREHRPPVGPEIAAQHLVVQNVRDPLSFQRFVRRENQLGQLQRGLVAQAELSVRMRVLALLLGHAAEGIIGVGLVQPVILIQDADTLRLDGRDGAEQVPHDLKMVVHLAPAAHDIADLRVVPAVAGAAGDGVALKEVDVLAGHLRVAHEEAARGERRQTGADKIGGFVLNALRLFRTGEGLIVTAGIIHGNTSLLMLYPDCSRRASTLSLGTKKPVSEIQTRADG